MSGIEPGRPPERDVLGMELHGYFSTDTEAFGKPDPLASQALADFILNSEWLKERDEVKYQGGFRRGASNERRLIEAVLADRRQHFDALTAVAWEQEQDEKEAMDQ